MEKTTKIDWDDLRHFLALHRAGTLAGAAARLGINATTVGRRLGALEESLGVRLFDRTPEGYLPTQAARDLLPRAEGVEHQVLAMELEVGGADQRLAGVVRLATTEMLASRFLAPHLPRFSEQHPEIQIQLLCGYHSANLSRRDADLVVRLSRPQEPDVIGKQLGRIHLALYASRRYLAAHPAPARLADGLGGHRVLLFADIRAFALENDWLAPRLEGARVVMRSDSVSAVYSACLAGSGVAMLPTVVAEREPQLVRLTTDDEPAPRTIWQGVHRDMAKSARIQAVQAFLASVVVDEAKG